MIKKKFMYIATDQKFGKLRIKVPQEASIYSHKKTEWMCDCGKEKLITVRYVISGHTSSCGKCNEIYVNENKKFGKLRIKTSQNVLPWSDKKTVWICDCGREKEIVIHSVLSGVSTSCGFCNIIYAADISRRKFGKLLIKTPQDILPKSNKKIEWICDCGRISVTVIRLVLSGHATSCGKCNLILAADIATKKFGKLRIKIPQDIKPGSNQKIEWICDCGKITTPITAAVISGKTASCGKCGENVKEWYIKNKDQIRALKCPVEICNFIPGGIILSETIQDCQKPFKAICPACQKEYNPRFHNVKRGKSLTCGCCEYRISMSCTEITEFIKSLGLEVINEHAVNKLKYDIFIPKFNLLIEFNGLKWHSFIESKRKDILKYQNAISSGFNFISIFEDEWQFNESKVKTLLKQRLRNSKHISIRPSKCVIKLIDSTQANLFYDQFHYIGKCFPKLNYGVFYKDKLISCMSFSRPTRQSKHSWELLRMVSDPAYKVHGIWSKLLKQFIKEYEPTSVVSFSDNRLFSGGVYSKIGFKLDGEVPPDYYWVKGCRRFHKSGLRKTKEEKLTGQTETQLREAQGYKKIWDLGKKRWVFNCIVFHEED
jgi:hypothetical protein